MLRRVLIQLSFTLPCTLMLYAPLWLMLRRRLPNKTLWGLLAVIWLLLAIFMTDPAYAITIKGKHPRAFIASSPSGWRKGKLISGHARGAFVAPPGTPPAECSISTTEFTPMRGYSQSQLNQFMADPPVASDIANHLSQQYNNVKVLSAGYTIISGYPAHQFNVQYSVGTPSGEVWVRGVVATTATTPGLIWSVGCGAVGTSIKDAYRGFSFWQSEMNLFPGRVKIR